MFSRTFIALILMTQIATANVEELKQLKREIADLTKQLQEVRDKLEHVVREGTEQVKAEEQAKQVKETKSLLEHLNDSIRGYPDLWVVNDTQNMAARLGAVMAISKLLNNLRMKWDHVNHTPEEIKKRFKEVLGLERLDELRANYGDQNPWFENDNDPWMYYFLYGVGKTCEKIFGTPKSKRQNSLDKKANIYNLGPSNGEILCETNSNGVVTIDYYFVDSSLVYLQR